MSDPSVTPEPILQVCAGLWAAGALKSGVDLKLFDALAAGPQDVTELSHTLGAAPQSLRIVLDALVALGLVALTRLPAARLTAQDWPVVLPVAQACAAQLGVAGRMQTLSGDLRTMAFGGPYDAVFLGHILHNYPEETCREILQKCLGVLASGGCVIIIEFLAEPGQPESTFSWLFSVMIHGTRGGRSFSSAELRQMLTECGASRTEVGGGLPVGFVVGY